MAYITLNKKHFFNNLDIIAQQSKGKDKIALVLKDNAYGHGLCEVAKMAQEYGITKAVVRSFSEAEAVENYFEYILVLADIPQYQNEKFRYTINDLKSIEKFQKGTRVELKVNTGMNRNGIEIYELSIAFEKIKAQGLTLEALFTHHSSADEDPLIYKEQKRAFEAVKEEAIDLQKRLNFQPLRFHSCNSAALFNDENFDEDMARVGIAAYGLLELPWRNDIVHKLLPILSLYGKKISQRALKKGESVGYGASFLAQEDLLIGNYDFGYGDGFLRSCSNNYTTPQGVKLLGRISMDNSSFLTTTDELLIFNDARLVAKTAGTISYEIVTSLKPHLMRKIIEI